MENVADVTFLKVMVSIVFGSCMLSFFFYTLFLFVMPGFIFVWGEAVLSFRMLVVMVAFVKAVNSSISVSFVLISEESVVHDICSVNFVVLMVELVFSLVWVMSRVV